jgi:cholesterol oxidase
MNPSSTRAVDAVVIGSGFGGAVSACRLAESGRRVLVLERGPRRTAEEFPRLGRSGPADWLWTSRWNGFFDLRVFPRILSLTSSGVGGGSHAYANVHLRAPQRSFREGWPTGIGAETLAPYYDRVERMLSVRPVPASFDLPKTAAYRAAARATGAEVFHPNLAVYYGDRPVAIPAAGPLQYVRDPYHLGLDVHQSPCRNCGECDIGCRYNAKNTLDLNYLALAEQRHGALVRPLAEVFAIVPEAGGYRVHYRDRTTFATDSVAAAQVVIAAGTINTVELLLRCRDEFGVLPNLSPALGQHFSGNGDFLCAVLNTPQSLNPWHGPVITTALRSRDDDHHFYLQEGGFSPELAFLVAAFRPDGDYFGKLLRGPVGRAARMRSFYREMARLVHDPVALSGHLPGDAMIFLGMGQDGSDGSIRLRRRWGRRPRLEIVWDHARTQPLIDRMEVEFRRIADQLGGDYVSNPLWSRLGRLITVHPLGGCGLADDPVAGVLDPYGEVWGYPNLFVADGSAIPRAIGPNPSQTISALAERLADHVIAV